MSEGISVEGLQKRYGSTVAVEDVSLSIEPGQIFGIVGPNGAGKTTTVESMIGLRKPDRGTVRVLGLDPIRQRRKLSHRIGVQLQSANLPDRLKVGEALELFAAFHDRPVDPGLLETWGLAEKRRATFHGLSGGQRQRLFIALALVNDPEIVFLDEITTGLDPQARRETWELIRDVRRRGKTVVLVTHFMEEVEELCDRVAIVDRGRVVAEDTPAGLIAGLGTGTTVRVGGVGGIDPAHVRGVEGVRSIKASDDGERWTVEGDGPLLVRLVVALHELGCTPDDIGVRQATLEEVFLQRTGRRLDEGGAA